jgi:hypothetical protein
LRGGRLFDYSRAVFKTISRCTLVLCLMLAPTGAEPGPATPKAAIQAAYAKAGMGARLKFVHGMLSHRAVDFELLGPDGRKLDLTLERERFKRLFEPATRVELTTKMVTFESRGNLAQCHVEQVMSIEGPEPETQRTVTNVTTSYLADTWQRQGSAWKLRACQVVYQQNHQMEGRIPKK